MATFQITTKDGATYEVVGDTPDGAKYALESMLAKDKPAPALADVPAQALSSAHRSAYMLGESIAHTVKHPIDTARSVLDLASGAVRNIPGVDYIETPTDQTRATQKYASDVWQALKDRWGGYDNAKRTLASDPVGGVADVLSLAVGGETILSRVPGAKGASRILGSVVKSTNPIRGIAKAVTPMDLLPEKAMSIDRLAAEGIPTTAGQQAGSTLLHGLESPSLYADQGSLLSRAAMKRVGSDAPALTPAHMVEAETRIGKQFDDLTARHVIAPDPQLSTEAIQHYVDYTNQATPAMQSPIVEKLANQITVVAGSGMNGEGYQTLRSQIGVLAKKAADPSTRSALYDLQNSLDNAMERQIANTSPGDLGKFQEARKGWRNLITLQAAAAAPGVDTAEGVLTPKALRNAVKTTQGAKNYVRGKGDFADLARDAQVLMNVKPGTNSFGLGNNILSRAANAGQLGGILTFGVTRDPAATAAGATAAAAGAGIIPPLLRKVISSAPMQSYLKNRIVPHGARGIMDQIEKALLAARASGAADEQRR